MFRDGQDFGEASHFPTSAASISQLLKYVTTFAHPSVMFRKSRVVEVGGYREFYSFAEDYDLWLRLNRGNNLVNLPEVLTRYRIHDKQVSQQYARTQSLASLAARSDSYGGSGIESRFSNVDEWARENLGFLVFIKLWIDRSYSRARLSSKLTKVLFLSIPYILLNLKYFATKVLIHFKRSSN
jgi:hypothetical protein